MKHWVRVLMIMTGIMLMLVLVIYTDPKAVKEVIREKYQPARKVSAGFGYFRTWNSAKLTQASLIL